MGDKSERLERRVSSPSVECTSCVNRTCGLIGPGPALAFRLSGNAVAVRTEPLGLWLPTGIFEPMLLSWGSPG